MRIAHAAQAATASSAMMPMPPLSRASIMRMGQGFQMSNSRNSTNPLSACAGTSQTKAAIAQVSSQTIAPGSSCPIILPATAQAQMPAPNPTASKAKATASGMAPSPKPSGIPASAPKVPGMKGTSPTPPLKASQPAGRDRIRYLSMRAKISRPWVSRKENSACA